MFSPQSPPSQRSLPFSPLVWQLAFALPSPPGKSSLSREVLPGPRNERWRTSGSLSSCCYQFSRLHQPRGLPANCTCSCNKLLHRQSYYSQSKPPRISIANQCACSHDSARRCHLPIPSSRHYPAWKRCQNACRPLSCKVSARTFANKPQDLTTRSNDAILSSRKNYSR